MLYKTHSSSRALLLLVNSIEAIALHAPLTYFRLKRRRFITNYVQPVMQQYESTTVKIVATTDNFRNKWKPSHAYHKIDTFRGEKR